MESQTPAPGKPDLAAPRGTRAGAVLRDEQTLLTGCVARLRELVRCDLAAAWCLGEGDRPLVVAAAFDGEPPATPDARAFARASSLTGTRVFTRGDAPRELARALAGRAAAAFTPVRREPQETLAVLMVAGEARIAGSPRTGATLDAAAHRLASPLGAAQAVRRLDALEQALRRLDRLSALGRLAADVAHEVRNPLVSVKTFLQLLPERRGEQEFVTRFLAVASDELARVERLLELVMSYPATPADPARADVGEALAAVAALTGHMARARSLELVLERDEALPRAPVGADALRQALLNLTLNAIEASPEGGRVTLAARVRGGGVELRVSDQGPGVPDEVRERIFEPFHSTRSAHGGLGLTITRRIVREAGGRIRVDAAPEGGARFRVWLPACDGAAAGPAS